MKLQVVTWQLKGYKVCGKVCENGNVAGLSNCFWSPAL